MRRLTILLAAIGALLLIPAAQAFAGEMIVNVEGSGKGEVSSVGGIGAFENEGGEFNELFESFGNAFEGSPPIQCSGPPASGTCETPLVTSETLEGTESIALHAIPAPGSAWGGWTIVKGAGASAGCEVGGGLTEEGENPKFCLEGGPKVEGGNIEVIATFTKKSGPTNRRTLTLTKSPAANAGTGQGSVSSKPKGIKCGTACDEAVASMYKETPVELAAKPATGSTFVKWENAKEGGACDGSTAPTCTVPMAEDEAVEAIFTGTSKAFEPAEGLTLEKSGTGYGTVKAAGLGCEAECSSTTVLYQGPIGGEKPKPGKTVILKQAPAFGSAFSGWTGCDTVTEAGECVVAMEEDKTIVAEYTALPNKALTVNKPYSTGNGSVSSKPKGIKCGTTCTQAVAQMPEGAPVELVAKPGTETTFVEWVGGDCGGSTNPVCTVTMNTDETTKAVFSKAGKAFLAESEPALTLNKAGSGFGTVKAAGLGCEVLCSSTTVLYQGPIGGEKPKVGKTVVLKAASAPGSKKVVWSGCDTVTEAGECVVAMEEAEEVTATFDELE